MFFVDENVLVMNMLLVEMLFVVKEFLVVIEEFECMVYDYLVKEGEVFCFEVEKVVYFVFLVYQEYLNIILKDDLIWCGVVVKCVSSLLKFVKIYLVNENIFKVLDNVIED